MVVDFFSPGCGGCRAPHPKVSTQRHARKITPLPPRIHTLFQSLNPPELICQIAEVNPDVQFLEINYERHKSMCCTNPGFYRGAQGRVCCFSCTNGATIKKFRQALAKHGTEKCSHGPGKAELRGPRGARISCFRCKASTFGLGRGRWEMEGIF
ncbi:hypothetical protein Taro_028929 [Colocasia esculenta]|uniref:Uncharacterized protein n=1 Tax=Colocasia esculenta TaxID=4460 RepID=A0A843VPL5_COLES|nr:hypothetical protein [Colocasia esculenta]